MRLLIALVVALIALSHGAEQLDEKLKALNEQVTALAQEVQEPSVSEEGGIFDRIRGKGEKAGSKGNSRDLHYDGGIHMKCQEAKHYYDLMITAAHNRKDKTDITWHYINNMKAACRGAGGCCTAKKSSSSKAAGDVKVSFCEHAPLATSTADAHGTPKKTENLCH
jgi:hypothetical protein